MAPALPGANHGLCKHGTAPEEHSTLAQGRPYGRASDIWALGCILYELCALRRAFSGSNLGAITVKIMRRAQLEGHTRPHGASPCPQINK